jgi:tetratricopeptide (TPR) repeat protein
MGEVFLADDTRLGRKVALKTLSAAGDAHPAETRRKLLREARAAAQLNHPNIAAVYDVVESGDEAHIVMEYVAGETLARRITAGPLTSASVVELGVQIADALVAAHAAGVVHRDLKPANIALGPTGKPKILDFGLAHNRTLDLSGSTGPLTAEGAPRVVVGTPHYMPPELLLGHTMDERGDIYSLGVTLFELLTGQRPYVGADTGAVAMNVLRAPMPRVRDIRAGVPPALDDVVARAMARRPDDRYRSAGEMRDALQRVADEATAVPTHPMLAGQAMPTWIGGRGTMAVAAASVLAAVIAGAAWYRGVVPAVSGARGAQVVAVLPLRGEGGSAIDDAIGAGLADVLASALSKVAGVTVLPRSVSLSGDDMLEAPLDIARRLGASLVVAGRVQRAGDRVRLVAQLVRADTGAVRWSDTYEATAASWFDVQPRIAEDLANALRPDISIAERRRLKESVVAADPAAFADYAQAWTYIERYDVPGNLDHAIALFESAVRKGPRFARAHAGLGDAYWRKFRATGDDKWASSAREAITEALRLDPNDPGVHHALAVLYRDTGRPREAIEEAETAIGLQPDFDLAHALLADLRAEAGDHAQAEAAYRRAVALRPGYWSHHLGLGVFCFGKGRVEEAIAAFRRVTELRPDSAWGYEMLGTAHHAMGRLEQAVPLYEKAIRMTPGGAVAAFSNLGTAYYQLGRLDDARTAYQRAIQLDPTDPLKHRNLGDLHRRRGDEAAARRAYGESVRLARKRLEVNARDASALALMAVVEAKLGDVAAARRHAAEAIALSPTSSEVVYKTAVVHALTAQPEEALLALKNALAMGFRAWEARVDDDLVSLRTNDRFVSMTSVKEAS